jgi:hypothetical protein
MTNVIGFPGERRPPGGGGPEDPMLEQRVIRLEETLSRIDQRLSSIEAELKHLPKVSDYASLKADVAEIKGRLSGMVTPLQLFIAVITTWTAGAAIVFALVKFTAK